MLASLTSVPKIWIRSDGTFSPRNSSSAIATEYVSSPDAQPGVQMRGLNSGESRFNIPGKLPISAPQMPRIPEESSDVDQNVLIGALISAGWACRNFA